jgi:hypothetical protein
MNSDNKFGKCCKCPARMSDGRIFTNWMPRKRLNEYLRMGSKTTESSHDYRKYLQVNAQELMKSEIVYLEESKKCKF